MEEKLKQHNSLNAIRDVSLEIFNHSPRKVTLYWHNYTGELVRYATLKPRAVYNITTFETHPWSAADCDTGDRLLIDNEFVFYPRQSEPHENEGTTVSRVQICLPVYPLWVRCLQILRRTVPENKVDHLQIPASLKQALKYVPDLRCTTYSHFAVINQPP